MIDGLPRIRSEYDSFEQNANPLNRRLCSEQIQKIVQVMKRGVRSNSDYSVVVLLGRGLADIIYRSEGIRHFSDATKAQFQLSEQLWDQLKSPSIDDVINLANYSLSRDMQWVSASKDVMSNIKYSSAPNFNPVSIAMRTAFDFAESGRYQEGVTAITDEKNKTDDLELRGLLKQYIAEYWVGYCDILNGCDYHSAEELVEAKIFDGKSLRERWSDVRIISIWGICLDDWIKVCRHV